MGCKTNGFSRPSLGDLRASYAMVIYIPDPLGRFLDDLRRELVPAYKPHAHISVLPPRPLASHEWQAREQVRAFAAEVAPFVIEASVIELFPVTNVIYVEVGEGNAELRRMNGALNTGALKYEEPYCYHPHITLAQELEESDLQRVHQLALQRWADYIGPRRFLAERVTLVQYTPESGWSDVEEFQLGVVPVLEKRSS